MEEGNCQTVGSFHSEDFPKRLPAAGRRPFRALPAAGPESSRRHQRYPYNAGKWGPRGDCAEELARHHDRVDVHDDARELREKRHRECDWDQNIRWR